MRRRMPVRFAILLPAVAALAACAERPMLPDLENIYRDLAAEGAVGIERPLIGLPGTLGSRLVDRGSGIVVWGGEDGISVDPATPEGARLLALPIPGPETPIAAIRDNVEADGVLETAQASVLGIPVAIQVYSGIQRTLEAGGFRLSGPAAAAAPDDMSTGLRFDYDWRRDIVALAIEFDAYVKAQRRRVAAMRTAAGHPTRPEEVRFDLLTHSMGGLITRYYLMHGAVDLPADGSLPPLTWEGARNFNRVVFIAPPNGGSIHALDNLVNGKSLGPFQPVFPAALIGTHPSTYELMPRTRHNRLRIGAGGPAADIYDPALWQRHGWGLADPRADALLGWMMPEVSDPAERRARALAHQARLLARAEQFHRAIDRWSPPPEHLELFLVVGGGYRTASGAVADPATGGLRLDGVEEGDGVVLRASALLDERQGGEGGAGLQTPLRFRTVLFLPDEHLRLTENPVFGDNLLFWLREQPRDPGRLAVPELPMMLAARATREAAAPPAPGTRER